MSDYIYRTITTLKKKYCNFNTKNETKKGDTPPAHSPPA